MTDLRNRWDKGSLKAPRCYAVLKLKLIAGNPWELIRVLLTIFCLCRVAPVMSTLMLITFHWNNWFPYNAINILRQAWILGYLCTLTRGLVQSNYSVNVYWIKYWLSEYKIQERLKMNVESKEGRKLLGQSAMMTIVCTVQLGRQMCLHHANASMGRDFFF